MIASLHQQRSLVLFFAGRSLLCQTADWATRHPEYSVVCLMSGSPDWVESVVREAAVVLIDATESPGAAMSLLQRIGRDGRPTPVSVYTETMHPGLELAVRVQGAALLLGPMSPEEWGRVMDDR